MVWSFFFSIQKTWALFPEKIFQSKKCSLASRKLSNMATKIPSFTGCSKLGIFVKRAERTPAQRARQIFGPLAFKCSNNSARNSVVKEPRKPLAPGNIHFKRQHISPVKCRWGLTNFYTTELYIRFASIQKYSMLCSTHGLSPSVTLLLLY